tara:strand:+ start:42 stop:3089 length:3048 start_codon:yes stop_codon:yes gene_type:complete
MGLCDVISDIIEDIVDAIVDIVDSIVDVVIGIIDAVLSPVANLLGFVDGETSNNDVEIFEVHNQALFDKPDKKASTEVLVNAVLNNKDIVAEYIYHILYQSGSQSIKKFVDFIEDGHYFEGFPTLKGNVMTVDYDEVDSVLTTLNSAACTISNAKLGTLFVNPWQKYWLQENKSYVHETSTFYHSSTYYVVNVSNSIYNSSGNNYTLRIGSPLANFTGFNIPSKPTGLHYIVNYYLDSAPNVNKLFVYKVGAGTYTSLDSPDTQITTTGTDTLSVLPAIPLRLNNTNFNASGQSTTKRDKIIALVDKVGLDAEEIINSVMEDIASANIANYQNKVDHVYLNFGVRVWDTSQIAMNYGFRFLSTLQPGQGITQAIYDSTPSSDEKPYNTILVTQGDYKLAFTWAYITTVNYTLTAINNAGAGSDIYEKYYSDTSKFTGGYLNNTYYVSSGVNTYNVGYFCTTAAHVTSYIAGTLTQQSSYSSEAADWMQPTQLITFSGILVNSDNSTNTAGGLRTSEIYERIPTPTSTITSNTTYNVIPTSATLKIEISGGGGGGGSGQSGGSGSNGSGGGTTYAKVYNAGGTLLNTYSAGGGSGGAGNAHETSTGFPGQSFGGPGSNGVPSGASSSFQGTGGQNNNDAGGGSASGHSAGGASGGDDGGWFRQDDSGNPGNRGSYYTVNHTVANTTDYVVVTIGGAGSGGGSGHHGGNGSAGICVMTPLSVSSGLRLINKANEPTTTGTSFTYYQNVVNGMNSYTIHSPKTMLRVIDAQTSKFKMVTFDLTDPTGLMIPFSYEVIKNLPNDAVSSLFVASSHISLYVADVQVIELPWWAKLLKIVQVLLYIFALLTFFAAGVTGAAIAAMIKKVIINLIIKEIVIYIAKETDSPELAIAVAIYLTYKYGDSTDLDLTSFKDIGLLLVDTSDLIANVLSTLVEQDFNALQEEIKDYDKAREEAWKELEEAEELLPDRMVDIRSDTSPMLPSDYYDHYSNWNTLAFQDYDYTLRIDLLFEIPEIRLNS